MARGESAFDTVLAPGKVAGSQIADSGIVTVNVEIFGGGEGSTGEPVFGSLGDGGRPLPPNDDGFAESISARSADGLPVIAARDLRIEAARASAPAEGTVYKAGYYGAELRFDVVSGQERSTAEITDGQSTKAQLDDRGVVVLGPGLTQGDPNTAQDLALADPLVTALAALDTAVQALGAIPALSAAAAALAAAHAALVPYTVPGSPAAPTTRAPKLRGTPGA